MAGIESSPTGLNVRVSNTLMIVLCGKGGENDASFVSTA